MLTRVLMAAILTGIVAGIAISALHFTRLVPLILEAETYETAHDHAHDASEPAHSHAAEAAPDHDHDEGGFLPGGAERGVKTIIANVLSACAFALLLAAAITLSGQPLTLATGILWGGAGFLATGLAPALGLAPELPGMPAGDLAARQIWWLATAVATAAGIAAIAFGRHALYVAAGLALIATPHIVGAPQPDSHASDVPAFLAASFASASLAASAVLWLMIGALLAVLLPRVAGAPAGEEARA